jgi:putative membrane protein
MSAMVADHHKALDAFTKESDTTTDAKFKAAVLKGKRSLPRIPKWPTA